MVYYRDNELMIRDMEEADARIFADIHTLFARASRPGCRYAGALPFDKARTREAGIARSFCRQPASFQCSRNVLYSFLDEYYEYTGFPMFSTNGNLWLRAWRKAQRITR